MQSRASVLVCSSPTLLAFYPGNIHLGVDKPTCRSRSRLQRSCTLVFWGPDDPIILVLLSRHFSSPSEVACGGLGRCYPDASHWRYSRLDCVAGGPGHAGGTTSPSCTAGDSKETAEQLCVPSYLMDNHTEHWFKAAIGYCSNWVLYWLME